MPADVNFSLLQRTCKLVVLLCLLHISVTVVFYVRSLDIRFAYVQNQKTHVNVTQSNRVRNPGITSRTEPKEAVTKEELKEEPSPPQEKPSDPVKKLEKCPETSPLLGEYRPEPEPQGPVAQSVSGRSADQQA